MDLFANGLSPEHQKLLAKMNEWAPQGACAENPDDGFVAERTNNARKNAEQERLPKAICGHCPVKMECLDHALKMPERGGIWGGLNDMERDQMAARLHKIYPHAGYKQLNTSVTNSK